MVSLFRHWAFLDSQTIKYFGMRRATAATRRRLKPLANNVFRNHFVAEVRDCIVGLGGHDQAECLQVGRHIDLVLAVIARQNFTQVHGAALGRDGPQHVRQVLPLTC